MKTGSPITTLKKEEQIECIEKFNELYEIYKDTKTITEIQDLALSIIADEVFQD